MKKIVVSCLLLATAVLLSCSVREEAGAKADTSCEGVMCTEQFVTLSVTVVDSKSAPIALDRIKVTRLSDGRELTAGDNSEWETARQQGMYRLADDGDEDAVPRFEETKLRFEGFINGNLVATGDYVVTYDCCHISLVSGEQELVIDGAPR
ncbi:hypothetical protein SAMN05660226_00895 [Parapedobacter luteus]|uniref:Lipoprotein n=1 Tax=Parapedobacter luteus TaxID=623280 RepID=A0A1T5AMU4_9SPHI|nr:hypothetical protein [Parapedobacter luteus]SKB36149.1 hypothetical protein SAMN05660226_00895 [Parapedobacter luteus]